MVKPNNLTNCELLNYSAVDGRQGVAEKLLFCCYTLHFTSSLALILVFISLFHFTHTSIIYQY